MMRQILRLGAIIPDKLVLVKQQLDAKLPLLEKVGTMAVSRVAQRRGIVVSGNLSPATSERRLRSAERHPDNH
jgi:hypothetical protein